MEMQCVYCNLLSMEFNPLYKAVANKLTKFHNNMVHRDNSSIPVAATVDFMVARIGPKWSTSKSRYWTNP